MTRPVTRAAPDAPGAFGVAELAGWLSRGSELLEQALPSIDALNVFPVPDGDTGTNLWLTWQAATGALRHPSGELGSLPDAATAWARAALLGARGNSGVILAQFCRGLAAAFEEHAVDTGQRALPAEVSAQVIAAGLLRAVELGYAGVARPVEGTILTVASAGAQAAQAAVSGGLAPTLRAAVEAAAEALARTPQQLPVLAQAGVVDAGGQGWVLVLEALRAAVDPAAPTTAEVLATYGLNVPHVGAHLADTNFADTNSADTSPAVTNLASDRELPGTDDPGGAATDGAFEVMYLIETSDDAAASLRQQLDALGASVVVVGGDGLWNVHVHLDDAGAAVEAGVAAGRVFRIRITPLVEAGSTLRRLRLDRPRRRVVAVASGTGTAALFEAAGASVVAAGPGERPTPADLVAAAMDAAEVLLLPNDSDHLAAAETAADLLRGHGVQVVILPTRAEVQGLAALAVHDADRDVTDDVVTMSAAAAGTQYGALTRAEREAMTSAGICRPGQILGLVDGDIAVIGDSGAEVARAVVERMVSAGGELVTLLCGDEPFAGRPLADVVRHHLHQTRLDLEVVVYDGGQTHYPLLIGVE